MKKTAKADKKEKKKQAKVKEKNNKLQNIRHLALINEADIGVF